MRKKCGDEVGYIFESDTPACLMCVPQCIFFCALIDSALLNSLLPLAIVQAPFFRGHDRIGLFSSRSRTSFWFCYVLDLVVLVVASHLVPSQIFSSLITHSFILKGKKEGGGRVSMPESCFSRGEFDRDVIPYLTAVMVTARARTW